MFRLLDDPSMQIKTIFASFLAAFGLQAAELELGAALPDVSGKNHLGKVVKIEPAQESQWLLVFFYPKALTGG